MQFLVNDLSFHGQFGDLTSFREAIYRMMAIRRIAQGLGWTLYCHRSIAQAQITPAVRMPQAVQALTLNERRAFMQWLTQLGPFWEDLRNHGPSDWLEWNGHIVTDTAVGEAGWCCLNGIMRGLVSLAPSNWEFAPVPVDWVSDTGDKLGVDVANHWNLVAFETFLQTAQPPAASWDQLRGLVVANCPKLTVAADAFAPLDGHPFVSSAAQRITFILDTLNRLKTCFDDEGKRTAEGHQIYRDFFTGKKGAGGRGALFSDSTDDEKRDFETEMTFRNPIDISKSLFCPWHGKVQTPQFRVHFSWPVKAKEPLYVVYIGPKITK